MTEQSIQPDAFYFTSGPVGCLLLHEFMGSPAEMRSMGEYLAEKGFTVSGPLLPGHGTEPNNLSNIHWRDWWAAAEEAFYELRNKCHLVFVAGFSMGALLALRLAAYHPVRGLILMAPAIAEGNLRSGLTLLRHYARGGCVPLERDDSIGESKMCLNIWRYDKAPIRAIFQVYRLQKEVMPFLSRVVVPTLIFQGQYDQILGPDAGALTYEAIASSDKELVFLEHSGHFLTVGADREFVWRKAAEWMMARAGGRISTAL
ncbi:MAG: alpha/beta fold hydrolase [Chloroflexi bacterium]|nr:alpha/beta fold hydrolase [Chloroflexota bacterium]